MADLGAIGYATHDTKKEADIAQIPGLFLCSPTVLFLPIPSASSRVSALLNGENADVTGTDTYLVAGQVQIEGSPVAGYIVRAYRRDNGARVGEGVTNGSGNFSITIVGYAGELTLLAYDNVSVLPDYNAQVFDRVVGV